MEVNGTWLGWGLGDYSSRDYTVRDFKRFAKRMYASYCSDLDDTNIFDQAMQDHVTQIQQRLAADGQLIWGQFILGVLDLPTEYATGFKAKLPPVGISVEGHSSNMYFGPVADTFTQLEGEGRLQHQPTGYDNGAIPFNNADGVRALKENVDKYPGRKKVIGGFSQGMIVVYDYLEQYGPPDDTIAFLFYGNPNRGLNSVAPWSIAQAESGSHGLDPLKRFNLPGCFNIDATGIPYADVWRKGDIFADEKDGLEFQIAAAVYQAVARGDFLSNPWSIAANIAAMFNKPIDYVFAIVMEIINGVVFLAEPNNPHYSPFNLDGGRDWLRGILIANG
jgi:hypothetical protein